MTIKRRAFIGAASLGAIAATVGSARGYDSPEEEYDERIRPNLTSGLGKGEAASMSVVWLPAQGREQFPPIKARLVIFDLGGKPLAEKEAVIPAFSGASLDYDLPRGVNRQQVFGYAYIDGYAGELVEEIFAGLEVYDVSSGRAKFAAAPVGLA